MKKLTAAILLIGAPENNADIRYATGFSAPDPIVYLKSGRIAWVAVSMLEYARALRTIKSARVLCSGHLKVKPSLKGRLSGHALALCRLARVRRVAVPPGFALGIARELEANGIRVDVIDGVVLPGREVKSAAEKGKIEAMQDAAALAMKAAARILSRAGVDRRGRLLHGGRILTSERLRMEIHRVLLGRDCMGFGTIAAGGRASSDPHEIGRGALRAGEPIVVDIFPRGLEHGYFGDLTRTFVKGDMPERVAGMIRAVLAARKAALAAIRPGRRCAAVHAAAVAELERRGYATRRDAGRAPEGFIHGLGHGVGLEIHERPSLSAASKARLRAGQIVTVEPGLYYPDIGGVRIEDTVAVTRTGCRILRPCPLRCKV